MDTSRISWLSAACIAAVLVNSSAFAATQGTLGATSTGTVAINASVPNRVVLSGLADVSCGATQALKATMSRPQAVG